jgi:chitodextrinase
MPLRRRVTAKIGQVWAIAPLLLVGLLALPGVNAANVAHGTAATHAPLRTIPPLSGANQLELARASLETGLTTHTATPHAILTSPGGYTWSNLTSTLSLLPSPSPRYPSMAWDASDGYVLLYGGVVASSVLAADTWTYANGTWTNITGSVSGVPGPRGLSSMAYDPSSRTVIMWGGVTTGSVSVISTWSYHNKVWTNISSTAGTPPTGRIIDGFATDTSATEIVLFGGQLVASSTYAFDTWTFKNGTWTNVTALSGWSFGHILFPALSDDPPDHGVLLFGLYSATATTIETATLVYSGGAWRNLTASIPVEPVALLYPTAGYLPTISSVLDFSSVSANQTGISIFYGATLEYSAGTWLNATSLVGGPPGVGLLGRIAVIGTDSSVLAFGGLNEPAGGLGGSTWIFSSTPAVKATVSHSVVDAGSALTFSGSVSGGASPFAFHWNFGDGVNATSLSASHTYGAPGVYTATLSVSDLVGHSVTTSLTVLVNPSLTATAVALPSPAYAGSSVGILAEVVGGTAPYTYHWSLGDATTGTSVSLSHAYATAGNYTISLNVTDALGVIASSSTTVQVKAAPSSSTSGSSSGSSSVSLTSGTGLYLLLGMVLLAVVVVALGVVLARRPKSPPGPPAQYRPGPGAPPTAGGPTGAPPAAWGQAPPGPPPG